jgi:hypothetical protein
MNFRLPQVVVHADWSSHTEKCWFASATLKDGVYFVNCPLRVNDTERFLVTLEELADSYGSLFVGFDFPIGLPAAYGDRTNEGDFLALLPRLGSGKWLEFFSVSTKPSEINLFRPFYPMRATKKGEVSRTQLQKGLGLSWKELFRRCELSHADRGQACPLFWTLGGNQVGKGAIDGWKNILIPGLRNSKKLAVWPFSGDLLSLFAANRIIVAETYPAEFYHHLNLNLSLGKTPDGKSGKRVQSSRRANAEQLLNWAEEAQVAVAPQLRNVVQSGFGPRPEGEDAFDAVVGLFGMLNILLGRRPSGDLPPGDVLRIEGWILGQIGSGQSRQDREGLSVK